MVTQVKTRDIRPSISIHSELNHIVLDKRLKEVETERNYLLGLLQANI